MINKSYNFVITNQYLEHSQKWIKWLECNESVAIIFPYLNDRPLRFQQFVDQLNQDSNINPIIFDPNIDYLDEYNDFVDYIETRQISDKVSLLVIGNADVLLLPQNLKYFDLIQKYRTQNLSSFNCLLAFESNIQDKIGNMYPFNLLFQNIDYYPLYSDQDLNGFLTYLALKWKIVLTPKLTKILLHNCAGSFWLAKEAMRTIRDAGDFDPDNPTFLSRVNALAQTFSPKEQLILLHAPKLAKYMSSLDYLHLLKTGFITREQTLRIELLSRPLHFLFNAKHRLQIVEDNIYLDETNVSQILSKNENSILKGLMQKPNTAFTRDEIATLLWPTDTEEHYSAWAIDQAAKRLRDKLVKLGLPATTIRSVRGVGYEFKC